MHLGYQNLEQTYHLNGHALESSHREKDLGVIIDDKLKFHDHTAKAAKKANQILVVMKRSYNRRDKMTMCTLYKQKRQNDNVYSMTMCTLEETK